MKRVPTIRDVAKECGLSHMTVSNVINNRRVSEATREQVLEAVRKLNYQPSAIARGLNRKPMDTLGVVLPDASFSPMAHPFYGPVLDGIMSAAVTQQKDVTVYTGSLWHDGSEGIRRYRDGRSDGLLLMTSGVQTALINALLEVRLPFIGIGNYLDHPQIGCVSVDDVISEKRMVQYLISIGHRRIAFFSGNEPTYCVRQRREGYRRAHQDEGIAFDESLVLPGGFATHIEERVTRIAGMPPAQRPTAICATNDEMGLLLLAEMARRGIRVPQEISVVGFDDIVGAAGADLTTMRQPLRKMGHKAALMLIDLLAGDVTEPQKEIFETELIVRGTTGPPPR
jgi:DNA-binding LacI/PurR family transcriptional regulator